MSTTAANFVGLPHPSMRETHSYELALEFAFGRPFGTLVAEAERTGQCEVRDLLWMGRQILVDLGRLARGEISEISIPSRLPRLGEFAPLRQTAT